MRARHAPLFASLLLSGLALGSCGEKTEDAAKVFCELVFECDCEQTQYADVSACVSDFEARYDAQISQAKAIADANGLTFDQGCVDRGRQVPADLGCDLENLGEDFCDFCAAAHGDKPVDAACTDYQGYSDCAADLLCFDGICVDLCAPGLAAGQACDPEPGGDACAEGLYCSVDAVCTLLPTAGQACTNFGQCAEGLDCAVDSTCQPPPKLGEPCPNFQCAEGLYCDPIEVTCAAPPGEGQPCDFVCAPYLNCEAGTCVAAPGEGQPCPDTGTCAEGSECDRDTNLCTAEQADICGIVN